MPSQEAVVKSKFTEDEIAEWLTGPITQYYFKFLEDQAAQRQIQAANGAYLKETDYETGAAYHKAMIQAEVYHECASPAVEDIHDWELTE